ncbi:MAG: replicative DNA helicase [Furfurilactobacillus sp.]|jgi:replicative DNA helicase|uniref:Replicative DNA helicase n=2 Tax=Furfurilactobacillus TaxID=2767882 RepID=A0A6N9HZK5_9LACO|nr:MULTISPECIES: replicative DNA helicase [Furfurilactobacillus]QLE65368.1 Replicative DNA helicase [Furfurilactobacillus rossiae]MCF6160867.1 replicative DNA helicase [Furfurilactobacillus milii]MCF6163367.1 replicative DNA helicase [Furfurilactobacillus milii]MCH4011886.1 replicative DNA helicase [Furfurilactobacillus sp.]MCH4037778.1 replicative DNA helicase [Furfurilactobacillus sp.]
MDNVDLREQTPPQNIEAEQAVLGAIFLSNDAMPEAMEYLQAEDFYRRAHQIIFQTMIDLNNNGTVVDAVTVNDALTANAQIDDVGGVTYIAELAQAVPTAANVVYYAKIVQEKALLRRLIKTATDIVTRSYNEEDDVSTLLENAETEIMKVADDRNSGGFKPIADVLNQAMNTVNELSKNGDEITGLATGFHELDKMTTGFHDDELIILAARPGVGKTAFVLNIAENVATKTNKTVALFSLEMGAESLVNRMLCAEGSIDANHLRTGQLTDEEWQNLVVAMGALSKTSVYIDDTPGNRMAEISAKCRRLAKEHDLGIIIVDYLQLIEGGNKENRQQEVSDISRQLKKLAKELRVPVIALSQLSRGLEQRQDKRPVLSDIRESGSIEQDADIVAFLYRDDYYERDNDDEDNDNDPRDDEDQNVGEVEVIIEKNRSGARGTVKLLFVKSYNKFSNIAYNAQN